MSRFFRQAGDSDTESEESDDESLMSDSDDGQPSKPTTTASKPALMDRFLRTAGDDSDSSSESDSSADSGESSDTESEEGDDKATTRILSAHERRVAEMESTGKAIDNALKINDWVAISNGASRHRCPSARILTLDIDRIRQVDSHGPTPT